MHAISNQFGVVGLLICQFQCGLITKSDAERLCSHLLDKSPPRWRKICYVSCSIYVYSPCFTIKTIHTISFCQKVFLPRASVFDPKSSPFSFKVQHECFGRCEGLVLPEAYTSPTARYTTLIIKKVLPILKNGAKIDTKKRPNFSHLPQIKRNWHWQKITKNKVRCR